MHCYFRFVLFGCFALLGVQSLPAQESDQAKALEKVDSKNDQIVWKPYSAELVAKTSQGKNVLMIFVADWCAPCKQYQATTLKSEKVAKLVREKRVVCVRVDMTESSDEIVEVTKKYNVTAIPSTILLPVSEAKQRNLPLGMLKEEVLVEALETLPIAMAR